MTPPQARPVSIERPPADTAVAAAAGADGPFVINLRSSTTPMALSQPNDPALARFKFFMSRRLEDGRERFRLHMGFFETLAEAEEWLATVREIYPGAWAGEAPGKRLKARAAEPVAAASAVAEAAPVSSSPAAEARATPAPHKADLQPPRAHAAAPAVAQPRAHAPAPRATPASHATPAIPRNIPVLQPAPSPAESTAPAAGRSPRPAEAGVRAAAAGRESRPSGAAPQPAPGRSAPPAAKPAASSKPKAGASRLPLSNVREVLAALDETGATRAMPALQAAKPVRPAEQPAPAMAKPVLTSQPAVTSQPTVASQPSRAEVDPNLSDTQVLKLLEGRRADGSAADVDRGISLLKPDDSGTRRALKEAIATNAPVSFAVQLQWSVQSIDISKVPPLAIFSAYTLYTVEGSREGRRWFGLRLGFFSDAISAKQVAHYVRSEFNSVAVVPVSPEERGRASAGPKGTVPASTLARSPVMDRLPEPSAEIKLIDDETAQRRVLEAQAKTAAGSAPSADAAAPDAAAARTARAAGSHATAKPKGTAAVPAAKRGPRTPAGRVRARDKRSPQTLEETLEILGADQLEIDQGRGEILNDTGVRHLTVEVRKNSPFTRLLDRLAERARGR